MDAYNVTFEDLSHVSVKAYANAALNPLAHMVRVCAHRCIYGCTNP